jgi:hypothetical protein
MGFNFITEQVPNISETLIYAIDDEVTLSNRGKLTEVSVT